jgi:outer membrane lipoprotein-sorting protein
MVWKHVDRDDDRWLYLPALDLVKRIAASDERTSFVGSDFFYEDVSGRGVDEDTHELVKTTKNFYVLNNLPKNPTAVEFASYTAWIHRKTFIPVKIEYFDEGGKMYRVYEALKVEEKGGYPTVTQARIKNLRTQGETVITYSDVQYDIGLPEEIFTERYLRNPPKRYLR